MTIVFTKEELTEFVEDIVECFSSADYGWTGLKFNEEDIKDVILRHTCQEDNELSYSKLEA